MPADQKTILFTVDLEDWFQVENFKRYIAFEHWQNKQFRFEKNTALLLELFETQRIRVTFFILGWCAERSPRLIREIQKAGHEIASHGHDHHLCYEIPGEVFRADIRRSKSLLEDITGSQIAGYRAPSFSITPRAIEILKEEGFRYDSSYNSFGLNTRYGALDLSTKWESRGLAFSDENQFYELPISNIELRGKIIPWGGGGYFRLYPFSLFRKGVTYLLNKNKEYLFYIHPWEIDAGQPRVDKAHPLYRFRHYFGQSKCLAKLYSFISGLQDCTFKTCSEYIGDISSISS